MGLKSSEPRVKGVAFRTAEACFAELRGPAARERARTLFVAELQTAFADGLVLAGSWYPISWYRDLFRGFRAATGDGPELARAIGYKAAQRDFASIYKQWVARIVSPQLLLGIAGRLFSTFYDTGSFDVLESRRGHVHVRCSECTGFDQNMWTELAGSCGAMLEIAGAKEVRVRVLSGGRDGSSVCEMEAYWV
jgi:hypothetical protein